MASSFLHTPLSSPTTRNSETSSTNISSLFHCPNPIFTAKSRKNQSRRCGFKSLVARGSIDDIPKQFREENLGDGLIDNYKNVPRHLYGLTPSQMDMFTKEYGPFRRQAENLDLEKLTSAWNYKNSSGLLTLMEGKGSPSYSMSANMTRKGGRRRRKRNEPDDLPSLLLHNRIVYLGLPLYPTVTRLIVSELLYLDRFFPEEPIHLYINSFGTQSADGEIVADEGAAYTIADMMARCRSKVYTVNLGVAHGQAAMLLSLGEKGHRSCMKNSSIRLYMPSMHRSFTSTTDLWTKAVQHHSCTNYYLKLLSKGTGKSQGELLGDIRSSKTFFADQAIEYGIVDKILSPRDLDMNKKRVAKAKKTTLAQPNEAKAAADSPPSQ